MSQMRKFEFETDLVPETHRVVAIRPPRKGEQCIISPPGELHEAEWDFARRLALIVEPIWQPDPWLVQLAGMMPECWLYEFGAGWKVTNQEPRKDEYGPYCSCANGAWSSPAQSCAKAFASTFTPPPHTNKVRIEAK